MRKTILLSVAGAVALGLSVPASASDDNVRAARDAALPQSAASNDPDRQICVRAQLTGSRLYRRICRTAREWEEDGGLPESR